MQAPQNERHRLEIFGVKAYNFAIQTLYLRANYLLLRKSAHPFDTRVSRVLLLLWRQRGLANRVHDALYNHFLPLSLYTNVSQCTNQLCSHRNVRVFVPLAYGWLGLVSLRAASVLSSAASGPRRHITRVHHNQCAGWFERRPVAEQQTF